MYKGGDMSFEIVELDTCPRKDAFEMFKDAPNPTIAFTSKLDVTPLVKLHKKGYSFNSLMMYAILEACKKSEGCHYDIKKGQLVKYDRDSMCVDSIVQGRDGKLYYMDVAYDKNVYEFHKNYQNVRTECRDNCKNRKFIGRDHACISTSAIVNRSFEAVIPNYFRDFFNPFFVWGKIQKGFTKDTLNVSVRIHHSFMDGQEVGNIFNDIQSNIDNMPRRMKEGIKEYNQTKDNWAGYDLFDY